MIVPHIAIVSSLLLGSDNPMSFEGVISRPGACLTTEKPAPEVGSIFNRVLGSVRDLKVPFYGPTYHSPYQPASMWDRGNVKAMWVARLAKENPHLERALQKEVLHMGWRGWGLYTIVPALILLLIPGFLGGMIRCVYFHFSPHRIADTSVDMGYPTSYTTPTLGLSCRSMTMLFYVGAQIFLSLLWLWNWNFQGEQSRKSRWIWKIVWYNMLWYMTFSFWIVIGITMSVGGTSKPFSQTVCFIVVVFLY